jgi:hypothetical protein
MGRLLPTFALATLAFGLLAGLSALPTPVGAQSVGAWTSSFLPADKSVCTGASCPVYAAQNGAEVMIAYESAVNGEIFVFHKADEDAAWVQKNANALSASPPVVAGSVGGLEWLSGPAQWTLIMANTGPTANYLSTYVSSDDGATWALGVANDIGAAYTLVAADANGASSLNCLYTATDAKLGCTAPRPVPDGGASGAITIDDNRGDPSVAPSTDTGIPGTRGAVVGSDAMYYSSYPGIYSLECAGSYCEVPFGTEADGPLDGNTNILREFPCFADDNLAAPASNLIAAGGGSDEGGYVYIAEANTDRLCLDGPQHDEAVGTIIVNPTAATGAFSTHDGTDFRWGTLSAAWDDAAGKNYVFIGSTLSYTVSADTKSFAITCGGEKCYFVYRDGTYGGAMRVAEATYDAAGEPVASYAFNRQPYFCADRGETNFAYNYKEQVSFADGSNPARDFSDAYQFEGADGDSSYLGKTLPASLGGKVFFSIEADTDGASSVFHAGFSFIDHTTYSLGPPTEFLNGPDDAGADAKGNGDDSGVFDQWVEAKFKEVGNDWQIGVYVVESGGTRTLIGTSRLADDPATPQGYVFTVDPRAGYGYASIRHADGTQIGNSITDTLNVSLPSSFSGDLIQGQWFRAQSTNIFTANTWLNNNDGDSASTCIYLLTEVDGNGDPVTPEDCVGPCGAAGPVLVDTGNGTTVPEDLADCAAAATCDGSGSGDDAGDASNLFRPANAVMPPGFTEDTYDFFLGLLLTFGVGAGLFFVFKANIVAGLAGLALGVLLSLAFGLFELWVIIVLIIVAVAIIILAFRGRAAT